MSSIRASRTSPGVIPGLSWTRILVVASILVGVGLRIRRFLENRPLWTDESKLALSIGRHSFIGLLQPLDYNQVAPVFYLWLLKGATSALGMHEWVLRLPSLIAGVLMMIAVWLLAREVLSEVGVIVAVLLSATGPLLVAYAAEAKPYETESLITAILLLIALRVHDNDSKHWRRALGISGTIAIWFSMPALLVLGGISGAFLVLELRDRSWTKVVSTLIWGTVWLAVFLFQRHLIYSDAATVVIMQDFWRGVMIRVGDPGWLSRLIDSVRSIVLSGTDPGWQFLGLFAPVIAAIATFTIWRRSGIFVALILVLPPFLALVASAIAVWPIEGRLTLFITPIAFLWLGAFADLLWKTRWMQRGLRIAVGGFTILGAVYNITHPSAFPPFEASRDLISAISAQLVRDPVYVFPAGIPTWVYYATDWHHPDTARLGWYARIEPHRISPPRGQAVMENEPGFEWHGGNGLEIVGRSTGMRFAMDGGWTTSAPDPNWGNAEARRMMSDGSQSTWVYGSHVTDSQMDSLRDGIQRNNGKIISESRGDFAVLWRVHFK